MAWTSSVLQLLLLSPLLVLAKPDAGDISYSGDVPEVPLECGCGEGITKVVIQKLNRTVMVPEFQALPKVFARVVGNEEVAVPTFSNYPEEILEEDVQEKHVDVFNVEYYWKEVKKRTPVYNNTKINVDKFTLVDTPFVNQKVTTVQKEVYETTVDSQDYDVEFDVVVYKDIDVPFDQIVYRDYEVLVKDVVYQNVTEIVETIKYVETEVFVWEVELYDTELLEKKVVPRMVNEVEVDEIVVTPKAVRIPRIKYENRLVIVHSPVSYINEAHSTPEFYNQTYKVAKEIPQLIPVPKFRPVPVQEPTYTKKPCALERDSASYLPPSCSACTPCPQCTICPVNARYQRSFAGSDSESDSGKNFTQNPNNLFQYGVRPSSDPLEPLEPQQQQQQEQLNKLPETLFQQLNGQQNDNDNNYEDDPYDTEESHIIEKKSIADPAVKAKEISGDGEGDPWAYWLPTINAYRAKFGL